MMLSLSVCNTFLIDRINCRIVELLQPLAHSVVGTRSTFKVVTFQRCLLCCGTAEGGGRVQRLFKYKLNMFHRLLSHFVLLTLLLLLLLI